MLRLDIAGSLAFLARSSFSCSLTLLCPPQQCSLITLTSILPSSTGPVVSAARVPVSGHVSPAVSRLQRCSCLQPAAATPAVTTITAAATRLSQPRPAVLQQGTCSTDRICNNTTTIIYKSNNHSSHLVRDSELPVTRADAGHRGLKTGRGQCQCIQRV